MRPSVWPGRHALIVITSLWSCLACSPPADADTTFDVSLWPGGRIPFRFADAADLDPWGLPAQSIDVPQSDVRDQMRSLGRRALGDRPRQIPGHDAVHPVCRVPRSLEHEANYVLIRRNSAAMTTAGVARTTTSAPGGTLTVESSWAAVRWRAWSRTCTWRPARTRTPSGTSWGTVWACGTSSTGAMRMAGSTRRRPKARRSLPTPSTRDRGGSCRCSATTTTTRSCTTRRSRPRRKRPHLHGYESCESRSARGVQPLAAGPRPAAGRAARRRCVAPGSISRPADVRA